VLAGAVALCASVRAAEIADLEGYLTPPRATSRLEPRPPALVPPPPAAAAAVARASGTPAALPQPLSLVWIDGRAAAAGSELSAREETVRLLLVMGVPASWRTGRPGESARPGELRVILLDRAAVDRTGAPVLGSTPAQFEGEAFFWVHVPAVRAAVGLDPRRAPGPEDLRDRHLLGVALGRVIAHETVHAVAPGIPHGTGLMAPLLKKGDLLAKALAVPEELGQAFRAALASGNALRAAAATTGDARLLTVGAAAGDRPR
jgi:hypothetical protein